MTVVGKTLPRLGGARGLRAFRAGVGRCGSRPDLWGHVARRGPGVGLGRPDRAVHVVAVLLAGSLVGNGGLGWLSLTPDSPIVSTLAALALFTVLFTDGQRAGVPELRQAWRLSGRALLLGMPLTFLGVALLAHYVAGLDWKTSFLVGRGAQLDPVFASAIVTRRDVQERLRQLLNIESGLNDGLALPVVVMLIAAGRNRYRVRDADQCRAAGTGPGLALGTALPVTAALLVKLPALGEPRSGRSARSPWL